MAGCNSTNVSSGDCSFLTADKARDISIDQSSVWSEVCAIQTQILAAIDNNKLEVTIADSTPFTASNSINSVTISNPGMDYDEVLATTTITHPTGTLASLDPVVVNGTVTGFVINNGGSGYQPIVATSDTTGVGNDDAVFEVIVTNGTVTAVYVLSGGTGYSPGDSITIVHPTGTGAVVEVATTNVSGTVLSTVVLSPGSGYEPINAEITIDHPTGAGFVGTLLVNSGVIVGVSISNGGFGYQNLAPTINITSSTGSNAVLTTTVVAGELVAVNVTNGGSGYKSTDTATVVPAPGDDGTGASVTLNITSVPNAVDTLLYYNVWSGTDTDRLVNLQLNKIINYFKCLGYGFDVTTNPNTGNTLQWHVTW